MMRIGSGVLAFGTALVVVLCGSVALGGGPDGDSPSAGLVDLPDGIGRDHADRFREVAPEGGLLVGALVGYVDFLGGELIGRVQPIYRIDGRLEFGRAVGAEVPMTDVLLADPGEAVGAVNTRAGLLLNGFEFLFMEVRADGEPTRLDVATSRSSGWVGDDSGGRPASASGAGRPVVGLVGRADDRWVSTLGLVAKETPTGAEVSSTRGLVLVPESMQGDEVVRDLAPEGGVLVGFRVGYGRFGDAKVIGRLQPIYRVDGRLVDGRALGGDMPMVDTFVAGPGDAVGAVRTRTGLLLDGFQPVFAEDEGDHIDLADSYSPAWIGNDQGGSPGFVSGEGGRVVGILVRTDGSSLGGLGLIVAPAPGRRPLPVVAGPDPSN